MKTQIIKVALKQRSYDIVVGAGCLKQVPTYLNKLGLSKNALIVSHASIWRLHGKVLSSALNKAGYTVDVILVPQGERSKSSVWLIKVIEQIAAKDIKKKFFAIAFGGGVVGDLTGFAASIYKRGVPYIQIPTSLLAQVDSSIGGKTGIDLSVGKNLVGTIYQPKLVVADTDILKTLPKRQMVNGMAEIIKYGIISDAILFNYVQQSMSGFKQYSPQVLTTLVTKSAAIKAGVVSRDENESKGLRHILNFGHTVGHAIESAGGFDRYQHGEAIALGMRVAARLSVLLKSLSLKDEVRINDLISLADLPKRISGLGLKDILKHMSHDKKFVGSTNRFIIAKSIGKVSVVSGIDQKLIEQAIKAYLD